MARVVIYMRASLVYNVTKYPQLFISRALRYMSEGIEKLEERPFFTTEEAEKNGISRRMLSYYVKNGRLERLARGVYCSTKYESKNENLKWEDLAIAASNISGGVICLISALVYYELTDEIMREFWIAVDNDNSKAKFPMCHIVRMRDMELGVNEIEMADIKVKIFDVERTIIDSFRLLDFETAMKALKLYLKGAKGKPDMRKLNKYITELRASKVQDYITALIA
ncbi:MAG: type IV toxin-antitoxin system AbiEi family antitoxin domain-containing protein [Bacteriovoracales bacterium]|nr:type IV toxin-antitoxin system AbiEi family antitoxin domain-containing protein [Bacteriovoracales bacterium]